MWVVVAAGAGSLVEVGGPGVGVMGVAGEVGDGAAQLLVDGAAEADGLVLAAAITGNPEVRPVSGWGATAAVASRYGGL